MGCSSSSPYIDCMSNRRTLIKNYNRRKRPRTWPTVTKQSHPYNRYKGNNRRYHRGNISQRRKRLRKVRSEGSITARRRRRRRLTDGDTNVTFSEDGTVIHGRRQMQVKLKLEMLSDSRKKIPHFSCVENLIRFLVFKIPKTFLLFSIVSSFFFEYESGIVVEIF